MLVTRAVFLSVSLCAATSCKASPQDVQMLMTPMLLSGAVQELKQFAGWSENSIKMATSIEEMAAAKARPLIEGLEEGAICPCCNTSTCPSLAAGRQVAMQVHEDQAEKLRETAAMLKQAFQTVACCTPLPAAYMHAYIIQSTTCCLYACIHNTIHGSVTWPAAYIHACCAAKRPPCITYPCTYVYVSSMSLCIVICVPM